MPASDCPKPSQACKCTWIRQKNKPSRENGENILHATHNRTARKKTFEMANWHSQNHAFGGQRATTHATQLEQNRNAQETARCTKRSCKEYHTQGSLSVAASKHQAAQPNGHQVAKESHTSEHSPSSVMCNPNLLPHISPRDTCPHHACRMLQA